MSFIMKVKYLIHKEYVDEKPRNVRIYDSWGRGEFINQACSLCI